MTAATNGFSETVNAASEVQKGRAASSEPSTQTAPVLYQPQSARRKIASGAAYAKSMECDFREWLEGRSVRKNTVSAYCSYLRNYDPGCYRFVGTHISFASKEAGILSVLPSNLFAIGNARVFAYAIKALDNSRSYETKRPRGRSDGFADDHSRLFSAFNKYENFLKERPSRLSENDVRREAEEFRQAFPRIVSMMEDGGTEAFGDPSRLAVTTKRASRTSGAGLPSENPIEEAAGIRLPSATDMKRLFERWLVEDVRLSQTQTKLYSSCLENFDSSMYRYADTGRLLSDPFTGLTSLLPDNLFIISNPRLMSAIERALKQTDNYQKRFDTPDESGNAWRDDRGRMHAATKKYASFLEIRADRMGPENVEKEWRAFRREYLFHGTRDIRGEQDTDRHDIGRGDGYATEGEEA
ncbi:hypothetical protein ACLUWO_01740 [Pseudoscardovia radai]|uniref:hypothetical protein n=1 Tax=Pseudoscardovia radai TaxID=987066 RepID=UPI0039911E16